MTAQNIRFSGQSIDIFYPIACSTSTTKWTGVLMRKGGMIWHVGPFSIQWRDKYKWLGDVDALDETQSKNFTRVMLMTDPA